MTARRWAIAPAAFALVLSTACGNDDAADVVTATTAATTALSDATEPPSTATPTTAPRPASTVAITGPASTVATTGPSSTSPPQVIEAAIPGTDLIELRTLTAGLGVRPVLRWEPVDGAVDYLVVVNTLDGGPFWMWQGPGTEVAFGGGPIDDPETAGAQLTVAATWFVTAHDAAGAVVASSAVSALEP